jgi:hypothetical protein
MGEKFHEKGPEQEIKLAKVANPTLARAYTLSPALTDKATSLRTTTYSFIHTSI